MSQIEEAVKVMKQAAEEILDLRSCVTHLEYELSAARSKILEQAVSIEQLQHDCAGLLIESFERSPLNVANQ